MSRRISTTAAGNAFRDMVAGLLKASGRDPRVEVQIGPKRVDIYFEERRFGGVTRYAVETKNYGRALTLEDFEKILGGYSALLHTHIDQIIVVSPHAVTAPGANGLIRDQSVLRHCTVGELQETLLEFGPYLQGFVHRHEQSGLETYFIPPELEGGDDLIGFIENWLDEEGTRPIAIIAGYGMGKTSFAHHLTYKLAQSFLNGGIGRIPVLVSLGAIAREQRLEGLIAATLTSDMPAVRNFNFPMFDMLSGEGRFLVILDGFDEMKHMMSEAEFRANFDELRRLVHGKAKVLLLGRPTAFLSEHEQDYVLRGARRIGSQHLKAPGAPDYAELGLALFHPNQVREFLTGYFAYQNAQGRLRGDPGFAARRLEELRDSQHEGLMSRPVHARMLADLATDPAFEMGRLTRFELYDHFVAHLLRREAEKEGRGSLLKDVDRRAFSHDLAWYLWITPNGSSLGCRLEDLPNEIFEPYIPGGEDPVSLRRALLSGSFLDEKASGVFYFAHRSFQEFLVSEYIWSNLVPGDEDTPSIIEGMSLSLTQDVFDFLIERGDREFFRGLLAELGRIPAAMPLDIFLVLATSKLMLEIAAGKGANNITAWDASLLLADILTTSEDNRADILATGEQVAARAARKPGVLLSAIKTVLILYAHLGLPDATINELLVILIFSNAERDLGLLDAASNARRRAKGDILRDSLFECVSAEMLPEEGLMISLEIETLYEIVASSTSAPIHAAARIAALHRKLHRAPFETFFQRVSDADKRALRSFYERDAKMAGRFVRGGERQWVVEDEESHFLPD